MWGYFALCVLTGILVLYVPGFLVWKAFRLQNSIALLAAPIATLCGIGIFGITFAIFDIPCNWLNIYGPIAAIGGIIGGIRHVATSKTSNSSKGKHAGKTSNVLQEKVDLRYATICATIGLTVTCCVFLICLGDPGAFFSRYDNAMHLNLIRSFVDSGMWSSLTPDRYAASVASPQATLGFYPAAWHGFAASICSIMGCSVPMSINASMVIAFAIIVPTSMYLLCCVLFPGEHMIGIAAAAMLCLLPIFPYELLWKGPLYPQIYAYSLLIPAIALAVLFLKSRYAKDHAISFIAGGIISLCAIALCQTNAMFSFFVFFSAYIGHELWMFLNQHKRIPPEKRLRIAIASMIAYGAVIVVMWVICFNLPFLQSIVNYSWSPKYDLGELAQKALTLVSKPTIAAVSLLMAAAGAAILWFIAQKKVWWILLIPVCLAALVNGKVLFIALGLIGCVECFRRRCLWLLIPTLFMGIGTIVAFTMEGFVRHFIIGFWYTDTPRVECCFCLFAMPIVGLGAVALARYLKRTFTPNAHEEGPSGTNQKAIVAGILCVCVLLSVFPNIPVPGTSKELRSDYERVRSRLSKIYSTDVEQVFSQKERDFVRKALELVPEDSMVVNMPWDGSVFAYGTDELQTYYRYCSTGGSTDTAKIIRTELYKAAESDQVRQAIAKDHLGYVLLLDQGVAFEEGVWLPQYSDPEVWKGINSINDDTPGFTVLLAEDDMRLYRIDVE